MPVRTRPDAHISVADDTDAVGISHHSQRLWVLSAVTAVLGLIAVAALLAARPSLAAPPPATVVPAAIVTHSVALAPGRAGAVNRLTLRLSSAGRPLSAASVTVAFSMPAMDMFDAFTVAAHAVSPGTYLASVPVVGMAGAWRLDVRVGRPGRAPDTFAVVAQLRG